MPKTKQAGPGTEKLVRITRALRREIAPQRFGAPVACVYNPLEYAWESHREYLRRFGAGRKEIVLVGMNPGPWGMAQTGVPFGNIGMVRDWMGIAAPVGKPETQHPRRPVDGFDCRRSEVSGARLWGWARDRHGTAAKFFRKFFVINYCPLCFFEADGRNRTPDKLAVTDRDRLFRVCDRALSRMVDAMRPRVVLGVGRFAEVRAREVLAGGEVEVGSVPHPSPANPRANRGWSGLMDNAIARYIS
jgi:single-strand selective monofunctional uracil DNA glycosylase